MSGKRILIWAIVLIAATFTGGFIPGVIAGAYKARTVAVPAWTGHLQAVLVTVATFVVFFFIGRTQRERPLAYAASVWAVATIMSGANIVLGQPLLQWMIGAVFSALIAAGGAGIGAATQSRPGDSAQEPSNESNA